MAISHCILSKSTQLRLLEYFILEVTAISAANLLGIQANSAILFYRKVRQEIAKRLSIEAQEIFNGDIEIDESYFGGVRKGKRGRGAAGKVVVFGMLKRHGKVYTAIDKNTKGTTLMPAIANKIKPDSVVYIDTYRSYMHWMSVNFIIIELIIPKSLLTRKIISMELKTFGIKQKVS